jgi:hypothetical protein
MTRFLVVLSLLCTTCAIAQQTPAAPTAGPRRPRIDGDTRSVAAADIRIVLALMPAHARERGGKPVPIGRIHVIDHDTMTVHYWIPGSNIFTYARRIKGHWRIDYADTERVIVKGPYLPSGS